MSTTAQDLLRAGDVQAALVALQDAVRAAPGDARLRVFLFQLLCVLGDWKRAVTQLKVAAELDSTAETMARAYREAIVCESFREKVFAGERDPLVFGDPAEWVALMVEAQRLLAQGHADRAADLRARAFDMAPATPGDLDGTRFDWIADADMRFGPLLEVILNGRYFWMPFAAIAALRFEEPGDLRDAVWTPASLTLRNGGEHVVMIPTRYPGTTGSNDPSALLARATTWEDAGADTFVGTGQRLFATDAGDHAIMDMRALRLDAAASGDAPAAADAGTHG